MLHDNSCDIIFSVILIFPETSNSNAGLEFFIPILFYIKTNIVLNFELSPSGKLKHSLAITMFFDKG